VHHSETTGHQANALKAHIEFTATCSGRNLNSFKSHCEPAQQLAAPKPRLKPNSALKAHKKFQSIQYPALKAHEELEVDAADGKVDAADDNLPSHTVVDTVDAAKAVAQLLLDTPRTAVFACDTEVVDFNITMGPWKNGEVRCKIILSRPSCSFNTRTFRRHTTGDLPVHLWWPGV
jgi:hypothetical protein